METIDWSESLFEGQLFVGEEGLLAAKCDLGDVGIVPARDEVLIALAAYTVLAHNLDQRISRNGCDTQRAAGTNDFGLNMRIGMMATASTFGSAHSFFGS